jgi:hypothetical protein
LDPVRHNPTEMPLSDIGVCIIPTDKQCLFAHRMENTEDRMYPHSFSRMNLNIPSRYRNRGPHADSRGRISLIVAQRINVRLCEADHMRIHSHCPNALTLNHAKTQGSVRTNTVILIGPGCASHGIFNMGEVVLPCRDWHRTQHWIEKGQALLLSPRSQARRDHIHPNKKVIGCFHDVLPVLLILHRSCQDIQGTGVNKRST